MRDRLGLGEWAVRTARLMVGIPSYETYVEHRRLFHPDEPIMSYEEFFKERQDARYATSGGIGDLAAALGDIQPSFRNGLAPAKYPHTLNGRLWHGPKF